MKNLHGRFESVLLLPALFLAVVAFNFAVARSLSAIRYHFTTCGASGQHGPITDQCIDLYKQIESPIINDNLFVKFTDENMLNGAQGFRVPRRGIYNITIAGAAGGRGLCNIHIGHGVVYEFQANLSPEYELLILVGQRGTGPCDANPDFFLCQRQRQPRRPDNASICSEQWYNWTHSLPTVSNISLQDVVYSLTGGDGGGGASMIWARHVENETFLVHPLFVSAGGGGSPAVLDYASVKPDIESRTNLSFSRGLDAYEYLLNGRFLSSNDGAILFAGNRGARPDTTYTAGAGGGFMEILQPGDTDGHSLSQRISFAEGGNNCANSILAQLQNQNILLNTVGGFGGGGGGCGGGGGGGGYTGGSVFNVSNIFPGSGGYSVGFTTGDLNIVTMGHNRIHQYPNENNGYIEIVPADCGCSDECIVNEDTESFECQCNNENHTLAENGFDCYRVSPIAVTEHVFMDYYTILEFPSSFYLYGFQATLNLRAENGTSSECVLLFTGRNSRIVLVSNVVSSFGSVNTLAFVNFSPRMMISNYSDFLSEGVLVTGAILVSSGECQVDVLSILAKISNRESSEAVLTPNSPISIDTVQSLERVLLQPMETTAIDPHISDSTLSLAQQIGIIVGAFVVIGAFLVTSLVMISYVQIHHKRSTCGGTQLQETPDNCPRIIDSYNALPFTTMNDNIAAGEKRSLSLSVASKHVEELPSDLLISSENLRLGKMVGEGEFGSVCKAQLRINKSVSLVPVAVKTLKGFFSEKLVDEMLKESKKMCHLNHPNVQTLIGVCVDGGPTPYIVMPFMENGSLLSFLRKNKDTLFLKQGSEEYEIIAIAKRLTEMCFQIAKGMEYLAANNIIHRDLAARNCMINEKHVICVSDFGLSENTYSKTYFRQENHKNVFLPMKWVAPESYNFGIFSEKTDVWSFGVTCWEVFSAGKIPYPGITAQSLPQLIDSGHRMDKPDNAACTDAMYNIMTQCWYSEADERPTFSELVQTIESDLVSRGDYLALGGDTSQDGPTNEDQAQEDAEIKIDIVF